MAKDDYYVIVFKVLTYLYAVLKGREIFEQFKYDKAIGKKDINEEYLLRVYAMMSDEGLIKQLTFERAWGQDIIAFFDESELMITPKGIQHLEENDKMKKVGQYLLKKADTIASLAISAGLSSVVR